MRALGRVVLVAAVAALAAGEEPLAVAPPPVQALDDLAFLDEGLWVEAVSRRRQPIALAPAAVRVLEGEDLAVTPTATVPDRLRYVPGVDVYQNRHGQYDVGLRGFNGIATPRTLALYDGREFASEELGAVFWIGPIHPSDLRRIEVVKGPASVAHGANAFGGVIALLPYEVGAQWELKTYSALGDHGLVEVDATVMGPLPVHDRFYVKLNLGSSRREDYPQNTGYPTPDDPHPRYRHSGEDDLVADRLRATVGYRLGEGYQLELDYRLLDLRRWDSIEDLSSGSNLISVEEHALGLELTAPWGELEYIHTENEGFYSNQLALYEPLRDFRYAQAGFDNAEDRLRGQLDLRWSDQVLTLGSEYQEWRSESNLWARDASYAERSSWEQATIRNIAGFAEHQWDIDGAWSTTAGLRVDHHNKVGSNLSPRLALNRRFGHDHFARLAFSSGYRLPTAIEFNIEEFFFRTDEDIEAEEIASFDLSWQGQLGDASLSAGAFYNRANGLLFFRPLDEAAMEQAWLEFLAAADTTRQPGPFFELQNVDNPNQGVGVELEAELALSERLSVAATGSWQRYRFEEPIPFRSEGFIDPLSGDRLFAFGNQLPRDINAPPEWKLNLGLTWREGAFFGTAILRYVDERRVFSFPNGNLQTEGELGIQTVPAYTAFDFAFGWLQQHADGQVSSLRIGVMDLFDNRHYETFEASPSALARDREVAYSSEIGRRVVLVGDLRF